MPCWLLLLLRLSELLLRETCFSVPEGERREGGREGGRGEWCVCNACREAGREGQMRMCP